VSFCISVVITNWSLWCNRSKHLWNLHLYVFAYLGTGQNAGWDWGTRVRL